MNKKLCRILLWALGPGAPVPPVEIRCLETICLRMI